MDFMSWTTLTTYTGAMTMVLIITQLTKGLKILNKLPTQLWSYIVALAVLYTAYYFAGLLTVSNAVLILLNGMIVALSANGGFETLARAFPAMFGKQ